jgi:glucose-1-phosphate adenylyltransferase
MIRAAELAAADGGLVAQQTIALVLAGGRGRRLEQLTAHRAKPAVPFAGKFSIIDFALSNCVNSGIRRIGVLTQYHSQSLIRHIRRGWGFLDLNLGEFIDILPAQQKLGEQWYCGTANAAFQNVDILSEARPNLVLILAGDHVYKMDYRRMLLDHVASRAEVTVASTEVSQEEAGRFGILETDVDGRVTGFEEKPRLPTALPGKPGRCLASMGIYVFGRQFLVEQLARDASDPVSGHDFGSDILPWLVPRHLVVAHRYADSCVGSSGVAPYWRDVGTVDAYWEANLDLVERAPDLDLFDDKWPILSLQRQLPPAKFVFDSDEQRGVAVDSLVSGGCIVAGAVVRRSILFSKVRVGSGTVIEDSVILPNVSIGRRVRLRRTVIDMHCVLPDGFSAGYDAERDRRRFHVTEKGTTLVVPEMLGQAVD